MTLLLDLGNTRLKWAYAVAEAWVARGAIGWDEDIRSQLAQAWTGLETPRRVLAASVVDTAREELLEQAVAQTFGQSVEWVRTPPEACGVRNAYAEPHRLGVDRFLAMVAARAARKAPCLLAGIGTALTLDALAADGRHLGGLIAPGPLLMQQSLLGATARIRPDGRGVIRDIADNTADAVASGCWQAAAALIERFAMKIGRQCPANTWGLLLDGGDADAMMPLLSMPAERAPDSVLRGLLVWARTYPARPVL